MRAMIGSGVVLLSVLENVTEAAGASDAVLAVNRGLSPIIGCSKDFSGDAMYKKIIADAEDQLHRLSCFVAGTLVHTKEGLRPIERIKEGDYVLSKPENGEGEISYKRVSRTFESENKEVWYVGYTLRDGSKKEEFVIATTEHPFRVKEISNSAAIGLPGEIYRAPNIADAWVRTIDLYRHAQDLCTIILELADGREAICDYIGPMVGASTPDSGVVYTPQSVGEGNGGVGIDFSKGHPAFLGLESFGKLVIRKSIFALDKELPYTHLDDAAVTKVTLGHSPLLKKVYNLEVEENHTYYVGESGVLVHNTCAIPPVHKINPDANPAQPLGVFDGRIIGDRPRFSTVRLELSSGSALLEARTSALAEKQA